MHLAISQASRDDLAGFWRWQGLTPRAKILTIDHGADFDGSARMTEIAPVKPGSRPQLLCVGIIEPRKNQGFLLDVCEALWREGLDFDLHLVGRVNPHFGAPLEKRFKQTMKQEARLHFHEAASDAALKKLYGAARAVVLPTLAEGCGLPVLEALWHGVPCVCSDLPVLRENTEASLNGHPVAGGCLTATVNDPADWRAKLRTVLTDEAQYRRLQNAAMTRTLPRWFDTAQMLMHVLR